MEFFISTALPIWQPLPMAVLVSVLYAFVRLGADHEVTGLRASGARLVE